MNILAQYKIGLPYDLLQAVVGATNFWYATTPGGWHLAQDLFSIKVHDANDAFEFYYKGKEVPSRRVKQLSGYLVDGFPVSHEEIQIERREMPTCDSCNEPCPHVAKVRVSGREVTACPDCLSKDEYTVMRYDVPRCDGCTYELCRHHPSNKR